MIEEKLKESDITLPIPPKPAGSYVPVVTTGNLAYVSGQIPINPRTCELVRGNFNLEVQQVLKNLNVILNEGGSSLQSVVKLTVFLTMYKNLQRPRN